MQVQVVLRAQLVMLVLLVRLAQPGQLELRLLLRVQRGPLVQLAFKVMPDQPDLLALKVM